MQILLKFKFLLKNTIKNLLDNILLKFYLFTVITAAVLTTITVTTTTTATTAATALFTAATTVKKPKSVTVTNGTAITLPCEPAEKLVRTHMAPDFDSPQLIRKLEWFLNNNQLIASYHQVTSTLFYFLFF